MVDFLHLTNLIQGEVIRIRERRTLKEQEALLHELRQFLEGQITSVTVTKLKVKAEIEDQSG
jgi:hypothetical protein